MAESIVKSADQKTATINIPAKSRHVPAVGAVSDGTLAGSVLELAQTLTKNNAVLKERSEERARLNKIITEFRAHLTWQTQRTQQLKRNLERLHNETQWLSTKSNEVKQDSAVVSHDLRQATGELDKIRLMRDTRRQDLQTVEAELKLEKDAVSAVSQLVSQAHKALQAHSKERDAWKAEADRNTADARRLKDRLEEMAYKINGLAAGTF